MGSKNKSTVALEAALERASQDNPGLEPLDYLLAVVRDGSADSRARLEAAKAAAPYRHPRLATVEFRGKVGLTINMPPEDAALL